MNEPLNGLRTRLQWGIVRTQAFWFPGILWRWMCRAGTWWIGRRLLSIIGVEAVYARHTHPRSPSFVPGHSDLDLTLVLDDAAGDSVEAVESISRFLERRRLLYYYLSPDDARIITQTELREMARWPPGEILVTPSDWTRVAGRELRDGPFSDIRPALAPLHPEFNRWWRNILQNYLLRTLPGEESRYHRVFYRGAIKQVAHFMLAEGRTPPTDLSLANQSLAQWVCGHHPALRSLLEELRENDFWEGKQGPSRDALFHEVLRITAAFHAPGPDAGQAIELACDPEQEGPHAAAYLALAEELDRWPELMAQLEGVLVYPQPHCLPYFYQADLLLPDQLSLAELKAVTGRIRQSFGGRGLGRQGHQFGLTLVPAAVARVGRAYRGTLFPFLPEHVTRHGCLIRGTGPATLLPDPADLRQWCGMFFAFFRSNLNRRIEHASRTLNFCHLGAVRLFLETGEIVTDPARLRVGHRAAFGADSPSDATWEYLLRHKPDKADRHRYLAASDQLKTELDGVEQLLR